MPIRISRGSDGTATASTGGGLALAVVVEEEGEERGSAVTPVASYSRERSASSAGERERVGGGCWSEEGGIVLQEQRLAHLSASRNAAFDTATKCLCSAACTSPKCVSQNVLVFICSIGRACLSCRTLLTIFRQTLFRLLPMYCIRCTVQVHLQRIGNSNGAQRAEAAVWR